MPQFGRLDTAVWALVPKARNARTLLRALIHATSSALAPTVPLGDVMFAYYDRDADIAWLPTGESDDVVSERVPGGLRDYDRASHKLVAIEVWDASTRLPASILEALPAPRAAHGAAA